MMMGSAKDFATPLVISVGQQIMTIQKATSINDEKICLVADDPVRPSIDASKRIGNHRDVLFAVDENNNIQAVTCVCYQNSVPTEEEELFQETEEPDVAIFYTIWSYIPGCAGEFLRNSLDYIKESFPTIKRFVTLSPKTDMAKKFHTKNGAEVFRENPNTVNYEYKK